MDRRGTTSNTCPSPTPALLSTLWSSRMRPCDSGTSVRVDQVQPNTQSLEALAELMVLQSTGCYRVCELERRVAW